MNISRIFTNIINLSRILNMSHNTLKNWKRNESKTKTKTNYIRIFIHWSKKKKNIWMSKKIVTNVINQNIKSMIKMHFANIFYECWNKQIVDRLNKNIETFLLNILSIIETTLSNFSSNFSKFVCETFQHQMQSINQIAWITKNSIRANSTFLKRCMIAKSISFYLFDCLWFNHLFIYLHVDVVLFKKSLKKNVYFSFILHSIRSSFSNYFTILRISFSIWQI